MTEAPSFPPLMTGLATGPANPFVVACAEAEKGTDSGLLAWSVSPERLRAALVLAPEMPLGKAMAAFCACAVGFQNALGTLAPPETAVHLDWAGGLRLNGGHVGGLRVAASTRDAQTEPDWLTIALELTLQPPDTLEPGQTPDWTALINEGCGDIDPIHLLEAWSRHSLIWINELEDAKGRKSLYREWQGLAWNMGQEISLPHDGQRLSGTFLGVDEDFGLLLKTASGTRLIPLTTLIEEP
jgi:BirA family transcriptional regulator, biotin operon repressor / biotin---[acetyl-CoA-carboxylase] ligase